MKRAKKKSPDATAEVVELLDGALTNLDTLVGRAVNALADAHNGEIPAHDTSALHQLAFELRNNIIGARCTLAPPAAKTKAVPS